MVFFDEQGGEHVEETKRFFVHLASYFSGEDFHSLRVGWENEFWTEEDQIQLVVQNQKHFLHSILPKRFLDHIFSSKFKRELTLSNFWEKWSVIIGQLDQRNTCSKPEHGFLMKLL